jgi:hypothetical protein
LAKYVAIVRDLVTVPLLLLALATTAHAQERARLTSDQVSVRSEPTIDGRIVGRLSRGTVAEVLERRDPWTRIRAGQTIGWVRSSLLQTVAAPSGTAPAETSPPPPAPAAPPPSAARPPVADLPTAALTPPPPAPEPVADDRGDVQRGLTLALLGSATAMPGSKRVPAATHVAAQSVFMLQGGRLGLYATADLGTGAGFRSLLVGGGVSVRAITRGRLGVQLDVGGTRVDVQPGTGLVDPSVYAMTTWAGTVGGFARFALSNRLHLLSRAQYVQGVGEQSEVRFKRYAFGFGFHR